jgi:hypothetical protein
LKVICAVLAVLIASFVLSISGYADTLYTYTYTGNNFQYAEIATSYQGVILYTGITTNDHLTLSFSTSTPLAANQVFDWADPWQ